MKELFGKNLKFFYDNIPDYYNLIVSIKDRRFLIKDNNIFDTYNNSYLYPTEDDRSQMYEISKIYATNPINNNLWKKHFVTLELHEYSEDKLFITSNIMNKMNNLAKECENFNEQGYYFDKKFLPATTIFGIMSGLHIEYLVREYEFQSLFIYEPEPEFFAISCYFIDYEFLYEKLGDDLFIFIKGSLEEDVIRKFYEERIISANFLRIEFTTYENKNIEDAKQKFKLANVSNRRGWGSFEDEIVGVENHYKNIRKSLPILSSSKKYNFPICVVANGSSLEKSIEFIKKNSEKMIIVSVGTGLKPLLKNGISSDFHIEIERMPYLVDVLKDFLPEYKGYFLGATVIDEENFNMNDNSLMFIRDASSVSGEGFSLKHSSPMVGNTGVAFALHFSNEVYLCGVDVGFKKGGKLHSKGSFYDDKDDKSEEAFKVKGNFSDDIYSNSLLNSSRMAIANAIKKIPTKVYNLSDGAFIPNTTPFKDGDLKSKENKQKIINEILGHFQQQNFSEKDYRENLELYIRSLQVLLKKSIPKNRKELTKIIDDITTYTIYIYNNEPVAGTLLRGSMWHILNNFYIILHKVDISNYEQFANFISTELDRFKNQYR